MSAKTVAPDLVEDAVVSGRSLGPGEADAAGFAESGVGKILIEVSLSKQNMHEYEITQIIREIFELNSHDLEVEKVVMPIGENTWQIRRANAPGDDHDSANRKRKRLQQNRLKYAKHNKIHKLMSSKSRQNPRKKVTDDCPEELDMPEVHSSPAITNLLSQLYPNPYNLINMMEIQDKSSKGCFLDASKSCKIKFKADAFVNEGDPDQEGNSSLAVTPCATLPRIAEQSGSEVGSLETPSDDRPFQFTGDNSNPLNDEKAPNRKSKTTAVPLEEVSADPASPNKKDNGEEAKDASSDKNSIRTNEPTHSVSDIRQRSKMTWTDTKTPRKRLTKTANPPAEKVGDEKVGTEKRNAFQLPKDKIPISAIHPMSLQKTVYFLEESKDRVSYPKLGKKPPGMEKRKCVMQYLKLIKDMYEAEEKNLKSKIDDAWCYALDQIEKPARRAGKSRYSRPSQTLKTWKTPEKRCRNSQSQTPKLRRLDQRNAVVPAAEFSNLPGSLPYHNRNDTFFSEPPRGGRAFNRTCSGQCCNKGVTRTDTFVFKRNKTENNREGLPIEVINRNVQETNRKIDLLIRHIDNSMDWLTQSEKTDSTNISSLIEKAKDLSEKLERNLRTYKSDVPALPGTTAATRRGTDIFLNQSYHSLHFFPMSNGIGSVKITADTLFSDNLVTARNLWWQSTLLRPSSLGNLPRRMNQARSISYPSGNNETMRRRRSGQEESEVPELLTAPEPVPLSVEGSNELGSVAERFHSSCGRGGSRKRDNANPSPAEVKTALEAEEVLLRNRLEPNISVELASTPSSLSISVVAMDDKPSALKPVIMQEITWNFHLPVATPVTHVLYRNERNLVFRSMEANVLHVARTTYFLGLVLMNVIRVVEPQLRQQSSVIISLHKCTSFVKNQDGTDESSKVCKFVVLPSDVNFTEHSSGNTAVSDEDAAETDIKVLKKADSGALRGKARDHGWDSLPSESSTELYDGGKPQIRKIEMLLERSNPLQARDPDKLTWLHPPPDPFESNPPDDDLGKANFCANQTTFRWNEILSNGWNRRRVKFDGISPPSLRYLSSDASLGSLGDEKSRGVANNSKTPKKEVPLFPEIKTEKPDAAQPKEPQELEGATEARPQKFDEVDESSSTSSFKSSNDFSDVSEMPEVSYQKKKSKSRAHFLDRLFHELRSFRKSLERRRGKRKTGHGDRRDANEFEDALSEVSSDVNQEGKLLVREEKQKVDEAIAVNTMCIDEVTLPVNHAMPRKVFKTSFRGKESVTELMIDLKDVSISEVSDISVEKRKLSTDHTKISIVISKQSDRSFGHMVEQCSDVGRKAHRVPSPNDSYHSLKNGDCLAWAKPDEPKSDDDDDDDDYKSVSSSKSLDNVLERDLTDVRETHDDLEPRSKDRSYAKHKFDFYRKMDSFDSVDIGGSEILCSGNYGKEHAPLKKALTDMQVRVRNIQKNSFCTGDEYYERALRLAKMSAGYCQSCKSKTVIPEDPLGIYQKFIPRSSSRYPYGKQRKYYFRTTSSTNSSFYSIHSSNSNFSDKFCHLNSSSSIYTNGLNKSRGFRETGPLGSTPLPLFLSRTINF